MKTIGGIQLIVPVLTKHSTKDEIAQNIDAIWEMLNQQNKDKHHSYTAEEEYLFLARLVHVQEDIKVLLDYLGLEFKDEPAKRIVVKKAK